ncbi:DNA polymerase III subunit delta [Paenibacillus yonginensis]|uniref:DNA polymerase III subunit delta n=1 Tax=Paenibacillus yonginensis TaxID=1462996 RepID=A0A1B1N6Z9_9BACL|nr:DNA polymerase III subunit delta [Paenibacillus yonginensis]ANS77210.1 DNA polymerase III subunit delta [Paenibacillus yonginensis]
MDARTAIKEIKQGKVSPLYLCYGTEKYQIREFVETVTSQLVEPEQREMAVVQMDLSETPVELVVEEAETLPFLVERKLVIVQSASLFTAAKEGGKVEHNVDRLLSYLADPAEYSVILFIANGEKLDERKKTVKMIKSAGQVLSFMPLGASELVQWVIREAGKRKCTMGQQAAEALIANAGVQMSTLSAEVNKLCLFAGEGGEITGEAVGMLVARTTEQNVFSMVEDIANLKLDRALGTFYELLKQKEEPIKIAALIARQFRIMLQVKELGGQSYSQQQIASQLGLHPYAVKIAGEQARKFSQQQLAQTLSQLAQLDYQMKSGGIDKVLGIEMFLLKLGA